MELIAEQLKQDAVLPVRAALPQTESPEILDVSEVRREIFFDKLSDWTIYELAKKGKIPHFKIGKRVYFRRSSLITWIAEQELASVAKPEPVNGKIRRLK